MMRKLIKGEPARDYTYSATNDNGGGKGGRMVKIGGLGQNGCEEEEVANATIRVRRLVKETNHSRGIYSFGKWMFVGGGA
jgi:hypothetical protein